MNRTIATLVVSVSLVAQISALLASPLASCPAPAVKSTKAIKPAAKPTQVAAVPKDVKCSVTGEDIGASSQAFNSSVYKGHTYYFCCGSCKPEFDANPAKYAKPAYAYPLVAPAKLTAPAAKPAKTVVPAPSATPATN